MKYIDQKYEMIIPSLTGLWRHHYGKRRVENLIAINNEEYNNIKNYIKEAIENRFLKEEITLIPKDTKVYAPDMQFTADQKSMLNLTDDPKEAEYMVINNVYDNKCQENAGIHKYAYIVDEGHKQVILLELDFKLENTFVDGMTVKEYIPEDIIEDSIREGDRELIESIVDKPISFIANSIIFSYESTIPNYLALYKNRGLKLISNTDLMYSMCINHGIKEIDHSTMSCALDAIQSKDIRNIIHMLKLVSNLNFYHQPIAIAYLFYEIKQRGIKLSDVVKSNSIRLMKDHLKDKVYIDIPFKYFDDKPKKQKEFCMPYVRHYINMILLDKLSELSLENYADFITLYFGNKDGHFQ